MARPRTWSDDDNTRLMQLVADNVPREEIARCLRKTRQQVTAQIGKLRIRRDLRALRAEAAAGVTAIGRRGRNNGVYGGWTIDELDRLLTLGRDRRLDEWPAIAREHFPGRTADACKQQYYVRSRTARGVAPKAPARPRPAQAIDPRPTKIPVVAKRAPPPHPQSLTAAIMGDPPPGRSALDQRATSSITVPHL